ncbi:hypothetical protein Kpol_1010p31 [Vanderwaltozyma polyspora DSM 70294]|uniref:Crh-like protein n=1 Tax=Vanderwaltozyma polyspora (strain ATCC 22028 / DSM 70294 / BCRC 21397 / CBS 2163 / NBRC 10782 / NRRL Y-8283 / UCD 57-17) TaxID=436907 RepID=A7TIH7_VANPO|nr:uncharacterized protein Kpol_1010p31 [Vanderwaltozyma polyspora DSM 70294]EDO17915.1 hypothetical protein Kpol_1010p31 [Vanderwaltozyma polyspora DSM 70294]
MIIEKSILISGLISYAASTITTCNPLHDKHCPKNNALSASFSEEFLVESKWFSNNGNPGNITYDESGLGISLTKRFDNPSLKSNFYFMYGKFEAIIKAAPGTGIVSSIFLQSDCLDEIDIEWLGGDKNEVQSNFFSKGVTTTYNRGMFHPVNDSVSAFHNYTLDWQQDKTQWYIDGTLVRTLNSDDSEGYPQTPMSLYIGIWAGGDPSNQPGVIEWAGGETNYNDVPFTMYLKKLVVTDYSTGSEYMYADKSGSAKSIKAKDGLINGRYAEAQIEFAKLVYTDAETTSGTYSSLNETKTTTKNTSSSTSSDTSSSSIKSKYANGSPILVTESLVSSLMYSATTLLLAFVH